MSYFSFTPTPYLIAIFTILYIIFATFTILFIILPFLLYMLRYPCAITILLARFYDGPVDRMTKHCETPIRRRWPLGKWYILCMRCSALRETPPQACNHPPPDNPEISNPSHQRIPAPFVRSTEIHPSRCHLLCPSTLPTKCPAQRGPVYFAKYGVKRYQKITKRLTAWDL